MLKIVKLVVLVVTCIVWLGEVDGIKIEETFVISADRSIEIVGDQFMLDGEPLQIVSGAVHYFKVPAEYWRDRLLKLKAVGANAVSTYIAWNVHEPEERQYNFEGMADIERFIKIAKELELLVILRAGPYINAEWEMGGFPYWLLSKYPNITLRTVDKDFMKETKLWYEKVFSKLSLHLYGNGGPIILVQIENEYSMGSPCDTNYKGQLRDMVLEHVGSNAILFTVDPSRFECGAVNGTLTAIDFGPDYGEAEALLQSLRRFMKHGPLYNAEYYTGWITHWGGSWARRDIKRFLQQLKYFMDNKHSVNMYMFAGGTLFEFGSGANTDNGYYAPLVTSYDFDAPVSEAGDMTYKYTAIRKFMENYKPEIKNITPPAPTKKGNYGLVTLGQGVSLLSADGRSKIGRPYAGVAGRRLPTFEELRQRAGLVLYETTLPAISNGTLEINKPRDRVYVYIDGLNLKLRELGLCGVDPLVGPGCDAVMVDRGAAEYQGIIDRETKHFKLAISSKASSTLSLLVENQGRLCFNARDGTKGLSDFKGILSDVTINKNALTSKWSIIGYPLEKVDSFNVSTSNQLDTKHGPVLYVGHVTLPAGEAPLDTFLDTTGWGKGYAWVNGRGLGRYWRRGPQGTLLAPGAWLCERNTLHVLELESAPATRTIQFIDHPIVHKNI